jgi:prepilin-type N-terminal cleavage/methylation domain-containing protein
MRFLKNNTEGFTLIEIIVTTGIVGVLSSIAVPSYQAYAARARQTEAKLLLGSVYSLEKTYQIEYDSYTTCLSQLGFEHNPQTKYYYTIGFASGGMTCGDGSLDCHLFGNPYSNPTPCTAGAFPAGGLFLGNVAIAGSPVSHARFNSNVTTTITRSQFTVAAMGSISSLGATVADTWTIDEQRQFVNVKSGI